jgi:hypothetical protein
MKSFYPHIELTVVEESSFALLRGYRRSFQGMNTPRDLQRFDDPHL